MDKYFKYLKKIKNYQKKLDKYSNKIVDLMPNKYLIYDYNNYHIIINNKYYNKTNREILNKNLEELDKKLEDIINNMNKEQDNIIEKYNNMNIYQSEYNKLNIIINLINEIINKNILEESYYCDQLSNIKNNHKVEILKLSNKDNSYINHKIYINNTFFYLFNNHLVTQIKFYLNKNNKPGIYDVNKSTLIYDINND